MSDDGSSEPDVALWPASTRELREDSAGTVGFSEPGELVVADANGVRPVFRMACNHSAVV